MHTCLNVDEIIRLIAYELVTSGRQATAVALACCCRSFEDPVLDALWETQSKLLPLLKCFPEGVWGEKRCTSFKRLPTTAEWARFRKYARKMRMLDLGSNILDTLCSVFPVLQLYTINEPLLPNLRTLNLRTTKKSFIPFIPLFLSPRTTTIDIIFAASESPKAAIASMITTSPTRCPTLQEIIFKNLPSDPMIVTAVSEMLLSIDRNSLQRFQADSPLTEEAREAIFNLPNLRALTAVIEEGTSLPSAVLPNLAYLTLWCDKGGDWLGMFQGATLGQLEYIKLFLKSQRIDDFLGEFGRLASASVRNTLTSFNVHTSSRWNPDFRSLLPFTQLVRLKIEFSCVGGCSSSVDDDTVIDLAKAMPKLESLSLGDPPCEQPHTGITVKGFVVLAHHCSNLTSLCIHFQVDSLSVPPEINWLTSSRAHSVVSGALWKDCALKYLEVGSTCMPEESVLRVTLTLIRIFPRIQSITGGGGDWVEAMDAIYESRKIVDYSRSMLVNTS